MKRRRKGKRPQPPALRSEPTQERLHHANGDWDEGDDRQGTIRITMRDAPLERLHFHGTAAP